MTVTPASEIVDRSWYNPNRGYREAMVPILIATLPMSMVLMIVGMSVAREQELGTFEQLLVSPLQPLEIIIGKAVPGLIVGLSQCVAITAIVVYGFGIALTGSAVVLFIGLTVFLIAIIGVALFISSLVVNQQQAMMGTMVTMMPAMLLSGFSSPVQNMPDWLQPVAMINPLTHVSSLCAACSCATCRSGWSPSGFGRWRRWPSLRWLPRPGCSAARCSEREAPPESAAGLASTKRGEPSHLDNPH